MPNPNKARGAKSRANLKRGGVKGGDTRPSEQDKEVRRISRKLLLAPAYQARLQARLESGTLQPGVEVMLWYYGFGKPVEIIETKQVVPVKIQHEYQK